MSRGLPDDPAELLAALEERHGAEVAAVAYRAITGQTPPVDHRKGALSRSKSNRTAGTKPKPGMRIEGGMDKAARAVAPVEARPGPEMVVQPKRGRRGQVRMPGGRR